VRGTTTEGRQIGRKRRKGKEKGKNWEINERPKERIETRRVGGWSRGNGERGSTEGGGGDVCAKASPTGLAGKYQSSCASVCTDARRLRVGRTGTVCFEAIKRTQNHEEKKREKNKKKRKRRQSNDMFLRKKSVNLFKDSNSGDSFGGRS